MWRRLALGLVCAWATAADAEVYRCEEPGGAVRFTSDPRGCPKPAAHEPKPGQWIGAPAALAPGGETVLEAFPPAPSHAWEVLTEAPELPDDEERALGLLASVSRHYTRARGAVSEVCTVELWSFARPDQAERARAEVAQPNWWGRTAGAELVLAHGVRLERMRGSRNELSAACTALGEAAHVRALATLRAGGESP
jgi:hypothetical protein